MSQLKFTDYRNKILTAINSKSWVHWIQEPTTLIDGFINQPIYNELTWDFIVGWSTLPMVAVVWNNSGRIYFFALKLLIPDIN